MFKKFAFPLCLATSILAGEHRDFQIWNYEYVRGSLYKHLALDFHSCFRWRDNASTFFYNHEHFQLTAIVQKWLQIGPAYRQIWVLTNPAANQWTTIYLPNVNVYLLWDIGNWKFTDRNRFAYLFFDQKRPDAWEYRNKLEATTVCMRRPFEMSFMIFDEIFVQQYRGGFYQNRFFLGFRVPTIRKVKADIGYMLQTIKETDGWHNNDILMLNLTINF